MISSRDINYLHPKVARLCREFIVCCAGQGIDILVYCTYRDEEAQAELYAQGRSKPGRIVTNARPGQSWHNHRCAFDFVPMIAGKPAWNDAALYDKCGAIAESVGLEWGGHWTRFREKPHCQWTGGYSLAQVRAGAVDMTKFA
jgi:peptidoglycan L-alanyl-D-glutamate endopeptidase CwlK